MQEMRECDVEGQTLVGVNLDTVDIVNSHLTNCNIRMADIKGNCTFNDCTATKFDVYGTLTVNGGSLREGEVKPGGCIQNNGGTIEDVDNYHAAAGSPGQGYPPPGYAPQGYPPPQPGYPAPPQGGYPPDGMQQFGVGAPVPQQFGGGGPESVLAGASKLAIKQKPSLVEAAADLAGDTIPCVEACCEKENEYEVYDQNQAQMIFYVKEKSEMMGCTGRCCCNPAHELQLQISQAKGMQPVMEINRPFRGCQFCPAWCDSCRQEATLSAAGQIYGHARQPTCGGLCKPQVDVISGPDQEAEPFAVVRGPCLCFGGLTEMCCDQNFPVMTPSEAPLGMITKEKPEDFKHAAQELMTDADLFTLTFNNPGMAVREKMLLVSTVLLLDYMFFEENKPWGCDPIEQSCTCTCFNTYFCGCYRPCTLRCHGGGEEEGGQ